MSITALIAMLAGLVLTGLAFAGAAGPLIMLAVITPFDAIPFKLFGVWGNLITFVPILAVLIKTNPGAWGNLFVGTRVQQIATVMVISLLVSHAAAIVDHGIGELIEWVRKVVLLLLLAVFTWGLAKGDHIMNFARAGVTSFAVYTLLSMSDYYLGIQLLPISVDEISGTLDMEYRSFSGWRFTGAGFPVNRYANYLILPIFIGVGWAVSARGSVEKAFAGAMTAILVLGLLQTVSRSALGGVVLGFAILLPMAFTFKPQQILALLLFGGLFGGAIYYGLSVTSADAVLGQRFSAAHLAESTDGRLLRIWTAFEVWGRAPFFGVGWSNFKTHASDFIAHGGQGSHNGYLRILAEAGLLAFIPTMALVVTVLRRHTVNVGRFAPDLEFWRPYFLAALLGQLFSNVFNDYIWERYLWINIGFAAVLERAVLAERYARFQVRRDELDREREFSISERRHPVS